MDPEFGTGSDEDVDRARAGLLQRPSIIVARHIAGWKSFADT